MDTNIWTRKASVIAVVVLASVAMLIATYASWARIRIAASAPVSTMLATAIIPADLSKSIPKPLPEQMLYVLIV